MMVFDPRKLALYSLVLSVLWILSRVLKRIRTKTPLDDLPGPPPQSWITGNLTQLFNPGQLDWHYDIVKRYGRAFKVHGWLGREMIYITDPIAYKHVVYKDQDVYGIPGVQELNQILLGTSLISVTGDHHRKQRKLLNPVFSVTHMRNLPPILYKTADRFREVLVKKVENGKRDEIDLFLWLSRLTLEYIGQAGMGHQFDTFGEKPSEYTVAIKAFMKNYVVVAAFQAFIPFVVKLGSPRFRSFLLNLIPWKVLHDLKHITEVMYKTSREIYLTKKAAILEGEEFVARQISGGKDLMNVLLKENAKPDESERLSEEEVFGQMSVIIFAAQDTTSSALSRLIYMLAVRQDAQTKLREEVVAARAEHGDLSYDQLMALPYLDAVVRETFRLYSSILFLTRTTLQDVILPLGSPVKLTDGREIDSIPLKNGTTVFVGIGPSNRDIKIWGEDAELWKPERWMGKSATGVAAERVPGVYSNMMTFHGGGKACIGFRLAELEMKLTMFTLLPTFVFELPDAEITWRNHLIVMPSTRGRESAVPHMPMKVSLVNHDKK